MKNTTLFNIQILELAKGVYVYIFSPLVTLSIKSTNEITTLKSK